MFLNNSDPLTQAAVAGAIPYTEAFITRVNLLKHLPVDQIADRLSKVPCFPKVLDFIQAHREQCIIVTSNLRCWVHSLCEKIGCLHECSEAIVQENQIVRLTKILKKEKAVQQYQENGYRTVFIGEGNNDAEAMRKSDVSIATHLIHTPSKSTIQVADYLACSEKALCRQLTQLLSAAPESVPA